MAGTTRMGWDSSAMSQYRHFHHLDWPETGLVLTPTSTEEVAAVVRLALQHNIPVTARGGGSGVVQGVYPNPQSLVLDLRQLNHMGPLDVINGQITVGAGVNAQALEAHLTDQGWTLGHWPQSIHVASIGGLVATKSIGQYSTHYGGIEDMVRALQVVTGTGDILEVGHAAPRRSAGPEILPLFIGAEGTLGIITAVTLKLSRQPESERGLAVRVAGFAHGLEVMRRWVQHGLSPSVLRLYDEAEAARNFASLGGGALLLAVFHGLEGLTGAQLSAARNLMEPEGIAGGQSLVDHWFATRNDVSAWVPLLQQGLVVDTMDVAANWRQLPDLYHRVVDQVQTIPGVLGITGHSSHAYPDGANLYFTFLAHPGSPENGPALYQRIVDTILEAAAQAGGSASHHHGVGRLRQDWVAHERGAELHYLRRLTALFDPQGLLNRGALWNLSSTKSPNGANDSSTR